MKSGAMMSEVVHIEIKIIGKGGHGSEPKKCKDPIQAGVDIYIFTRELCKKYEENNRNFRLTIPHFEAGSVCNVIPDKAVLEGTFRSFDEQFTKEFIEEFSKKVDEICTKHSCTNEKTIKSLYPPVLNSEKETESLTKTAKEFFGNDKVLEDILPVYASEDFSRYLKEKPGCFFFLASAKTENDGYLHTENFNFNDDVIAVGANFWLKIAEERLGLEKSLFNVPNAQESLKEIRVLEEEEAKNKEKVKETSKKIKKGRKKN